MTTTIRPSKIDRAAVSVGAALLDRVEPGWERRIDRKKLDVSDPYTCPLGQLFGHYIDGIQTLEDTIGDDVSAAEHGFNVPWKGYPDFVNPEKKDGYTRLTNKLGHDLGYT